MRILLCESDPRAREHVAAILHQAGHETVAVEHGQAAQRGDLERFDVLVADLFGAEVDGLALAEQLRTRRGGGSLPTIVLSVLSSRQVRRLPGSDPAAVVVRKPIARRSILRALRRATAVRPGHGS